MILGAKSLKMAKGMYLANYAKGWQGLGAITPMGLNTFKQWIDSPAFRKPVSEELRIRLGLKTVGDTVIKPARPPRKAAKRPTTSTISPGVRPRHPRLPPWTKPAGPAKAWLHTPWTSSGRGRTRLGGNWPVRR